ncbi:PrsW family intramembrane metalloprotease [Candidatus Micrarchaeota archaeon]|nr:PrsW family intramembrane metalloprotease [Candidatus Micrarchaeota archaeon]
MIKLVNNVFLSFLVIVAVIGMVFSILTLFPSFLLQDASYNRVLSLDRADSFVLSNDLESINPDDSPYQNPVTLTIPPLSDNDAVFVDVYSNKQLLSEVDCLSNYQSVAGLDSITCNVSLPYGYYKKENYTLLAILYQDSKESISNPIAIAADWSPYEKSFWGFSGNLLIILLLIFIFILAPIAILTLYLASRLKHEKSYPEEFSLSSLINPLSKARTLQEKINAILLSPYFWLIEIAGILILVFYLALSGKVFESTTAIISFAISGLIAFVIPFFWCILWWYADYKQREPLRMIITLFLWGSLAALMVVGFNTVAGILFGLLGIGVISTFLVAPILEEFYKGAGLALLSSNDEYDSIEDGIVFGFTVGMGFAFIENWLYFMNNPLGSDIGSWVYLFFLRSILFSANHGFYTAITGAFIGWVKEKDFKAPALGLLGFPIASFFHLIHNSGELLAGLLGIGGYLLYCCFLIPIFDYGGFFLMILLFLRSLLRKR